MFGVYGFWCFLEFFIYTKLLLVSLGFGVYGFCLFFIYTKLFGTFVFALGRPKMLGTIFGFGARFWGDILGAISGREIGHRRRGASGGAGGAEGGGGGGGVGQGQGCG